MKGTIVIQVFYKGHKQRPLRIAQSIFTQMGQDPNKVDVSFTYHLMRCTANVVVNGKLRIAPMTIGLVVMVYVDDIKKGIKQAEAIKLGPNISYIDVQLLVRPEYYFHLKER